MIVDFFISFFTTIINFGLSLLPAWNTTSWLLNEPWSPPPHTDPVTGFDMNGNPLFEIMSMAARVNQFLPVDQFLVILNVGVFVFFLMMMYKFVRFIIGTVRGAGTS